MCHTKITAGHNTMRNVQGYSNDTWFISSSEDGHEITWPWPIFRDPVT